MSIAIDLMGSDSSPSTLFRGVWEAVLALPHIKFFHLLATSQAKEEICSSPLYKSNPLLAQRFSWHLASQVIEMEDSPMHAIRRKRDSSMILGLLLLKDQAVDALVSAGNTGALAIGARALVKTLPGIQVPALAAVFPTCKKKMVVLDVGGNVSCEAEHLVQFALMGTAYHHCLFEEKKVRVGLLNIGRESRKGTDVHQEAYRVLQELGEKKKAPFVFEGNVEGKEAFMGKVDVLVTEGFTGNVFLKTAEGVSTFLIHTLKEAAADADKEWSSSIFKHVDQQFAYDEYPGATLCGTNGLVIKCHGDSSSKAMFQGIKGAASLLEKKWSKKMQGLLMKW